MRIIIELIALVVLGTAGWYVWNSGGVPFAGSNQNADTATSAGMLAEDNAIVIGAQKPGNVVSASLVHLKTPGYVVVHEDNSGEFGVVLGASGLLSSGESTHVRIDLLRSVRDGETLYAILHADDGNGRFGNEDMAFESILGGPIHGIFEISNEAPEAPGDIPVSI